MKTNIIKMKNMFFY